MPNRVRLVIHGRVQGVGYRAWLAGEARRRGLAGWVRNRRDDTVEALIEGSGAELSDMIEACRHGPNAAHVSDVDIMPVETGEIAAGEFAVRPTA